MRLVLLNKLEISVQFYALYEKECFLAYFWRVSSEIDAYLLITPDSRRLFLKKITQISEYAVIIFRKIVQDFRGTLTLDLPKKIIKRPMGFDHKTTHYVMLLSYCLFKCCTTSVDKWAAWWMPELSQCCSSLICVLLVMTAWFKLFRYFHCQFIIIHYQLRLWIDVVMVIYAPSKCLWQQR